MAKQSKPEQVTVEEPADSFQEKESAEIISDEAAEDTVAGATEGDELPQKRKSHFDPDEAPKDREKAAEPTPEPLTNEKALRAAARKILADAQAIGLSGAQIMREEAGF